MSGTVNPLALSGAANPLTPPGAFNPLTPPIAGAPPMAQPAGPPASAQVNQASISRGMRGGTQEQLLRRRDASGKEMEILAKVANDPKPDRKEISDYIEKLLRMEHIPRETASQILASLPHDPDGLRNWARSMFSFVMHQGIHAHAAFPLSSFPRASQDSETPVGAAAPVNDAAGNNANQSPQGS